MVYYDFKLNIFVLNYKMLNRLDNYYIIINKLIQYNTLQYNTINNHK